LLSERFSSTRSPSRSRGLNLHTTGLILMIVGVLGLILGLYFWISGRNRPIPPPELS